MAKKIVTPARPVIVVFGASGVGKTFGCLGWPDVYYIDTELGATQQHYQDQLKSNGGTYQQVTDLKEVVARVRHLASSTHKHKTVVVDSLTNPYTLDVDAEYAKMQDAGVDMQNTFGSERRPADQLVRQLVTCLLHADLNGILVCHEKGKWKDGTQIGETYDCWAKLDYQLQLAFRITHNVASGERMAIVTKSREAGFNVGDMFPWCYDEFASRYGKEICEKAHKGSKPSNKAQQDEMIRLIDKLNVDPKLIKKWHDAAGAGTWGDFTEYQLEKCIELIKKEWEK